MWGALVRLIAMKFVGNRLQLFGLQLMNVVERRTHILSGNLSLEWHRLVKTLISFFVVSAALVFAGLIGLAWLIAIALDSPSRNLILGIALATPLVVALGLALYIRQLWHQRPFLHLYRDQVDQDWRTLKTALDDVPDPTVAEPAKAL